MRRQRLQLFGPLARGGGRSRSPPWRRLQLVELQRDDADAAPASTRGGAASTAANTDVSGKVSVIGVWTGDEQKIFQAVLDAFKSSTRT